MSAIYSTSRALKCAPLDLVTEMTCLGSMDDAFCAQASIRMRSSPHSAACANASFLPGQFDEFMSSCGRLKLCDGFSLACVARANARCRGLVSHIHGHSGLYVCLCRWGCRPPQASIALQPSLNRYKKNCESFAGAIGLSSDQHSARARWPWALRLCCTSCLHTSPWATC